MLAMLQWKYSDEKSLYRVLNEPWVKDLNGWREAHSALEYATDADSRQC